MVPFLVTGALIGMVIGVVLSLLGPSSQVASPGQELIVMAGSGALVGGFVGAVLYLIAEWSSLRRM
jgi:H+/Cl- antiporter ClcA